MEHDFIVGSTIFTRKGVRKMYRYFVKLFASNLDIKDNCKIYADIDYFNKKGEENV